VVHFRTGATVLSLSHSFHKGPGPQPDLRLKGTGFSSPLEKWPLHRSYHSPPFSTEVKMSGNISLFCHKTSWLA